MIPRRGFLARTLQGLSAGVLRMRGARAADTPYHFHPKYKSAAPLDAMLANLRPGADFPGEAVHERMAAVLAGWRAGFDIERSLAPDFQGSSLVPVESRAVRRGPALEVRKVRFNHQATLGAEAFVREWKRELGSCAADFQVTRLAAAPGLVSTRVRYEFVAGGAGFHREQRVGYWDLQWTEDLKVRAWHATQETRSRSGERWFVDVTSATLPASPQLAHGIDYWRTVLDGACGIDVYGHHGVSVGDLHGDGRDDLYVCQPAGLPNRVYRNRGDGTFEDVTESSGLGLLDNTACALIADFDNDGRQDVVVVRASGPVLFVNRGGGKFARQAGAFRFKTPPRGTFTGASAADYDGDGRLDLYFCLYAYYQGTDQYQYPVPYYAAENGPPNFLMHNQGDGTFTDVTAAAGLDANNTRYSFCCGWYDYDRDGRPDLYVVNDFGRKNLYHNDGGGKFTDVAALAGVEDVGAGMAVCWFDGDGDGAPDLYVANMWSAAGERISMQENFQSGAPQAVQALYRKHAMGNSLLRNAGGKFEDATAAAGVGIGRWAWSSDAWDFDHDGFEDLYVTNGMLSGPVRDDLNGFFWRQVVAHSPAEAKPSPEYEQGWKAVNELIRADYTWSGYERNVFYASDRDGSFSDVSAAVGLDFLEDGRAFALADFDGDGRVEVFLKNRNAPQLRVLKNVVRELPPSIAFRLRGGKSNRDAIGAVVTVGKQAKSVVAGSGFLSQHSKELFFGLGDAAGPVEATVRWPSGTVQHFGNLPANHRIFLAEGSDTARPEPFRVARAVEGRAQGGGESLPETVETWLLAPIPAALAPDARGKRLITLRADDPPERLAVYNLIYRYLFDRHRDLTLPASFLCDEQGDIVKLYQGAVSPARVEEDARRIPKTAAERLARALPFRGAADSYEYGRNHLSLGSVFFQRGYMEQAEAAFRLAQKDDPASAEAEYGIGSVYLKQEKAQQARESFARAVKLEAGYPETLPNAWNNLGLLATREGRMDEAVQHFQTALRISPDYWIALQNLGNAYRLQKRWNDARELLERALAARPRDAEANYNLAMVYAQTGNAERAHDYLTRALALRPGYPEALNNLGILYLRTRRRDDAVAKFEQCIRVAPGFDQAYLNLARVYSVEGANEKARAVLRELLKQHPGHAQARRALEQLP